MITKVGCFCLLILLGANAYAEENKLLFLVCHVDTKFQGIVDAPFRVNFSTSTVNGLDANIYEDKIEWKTGDTNFSISRLNGYFISTNYVNNLVITGSCEKVNNKKF